MVAKKQGAGARKKVVASKEVAKVDNIGGLGVVSIAGLSYYMVGKR